MEFFQNFNPKYSANLKEDEIKNLIDLVVLHRIRKTKAEIRRNIEMGGVYINDSRVTIEMANGVNFLKENLLANRYLVLKIGKKNYYLLEIL